MNKVKVVSLFSGCGGGACGLTLVGHDVIFAHNEINKAKNSSKSNPVASETFYKNMEHVVRDCPIETLDAELIPDCDVIIGNPRDDMRLFREFQQVVAYKQPLLFCVDCHISMLDDEHIPTYAEILKDFYDAGYITHVCDFGRLFFFGVRKDLYEDGIRFRAPIEHITREEVTVDWKTAERLLSEGTLSESDFASFRHFPTFFQFAGSITQVKKQIVESWDVDLAKQIGLKITEALDNESI